MFLVWNWTSVFSHPVNNMMRDQINRFLSDVLLDRTYLSLAFWSKSWSLSEYCINSLSILHNLSSKSFTKDKKCLNSKSASPSSSFNFSIKRSFYPSGRLQLLSVQPNQTVLFETVKIPGLVPWIVLWPIIHGPYPMRFKCKRPFEKEIDRLSRSDCQTWGRDVARDMPLNRDWGIE